MLSIFIQTASSFKIDPYPKGASLRETFSMNCLQMTQSQQMLKAYIMIGLKSKFQNPKKNLAKAIVDYDKRIYQIRDYFNANFRTKYDKKSFDKAIELWKKNKEILESEPSKERALLIKKNFLLMILKLLDGTKPLVSSELKLISLTGKLCRKPMEITIDYLIRMWGEEIKDYEKNTKIIIDKYHENLKELSTNSLNNQETFRLLEKAKKEFKFFEFMYNSKTKFIPSLLSKKADDNFLIIRSIKKIYNNKQAL